jgi:N-acetylglucosaminyl-diphospho-decaprenol L-rhamnosyltransferase
MAHVDVGVVTWNSRDVTVDALRRLLEVTGGVDVRLLVRDNDSSDGTADAIAAAFPEAVVDPGRENLGFAAGMNTLIARSDAPWFFALNPDAWPEPGCLDVLVRAAEANPQAAAVAPRILRPDGTLEHSTLPFPSLRVALMMAAGAQRWFPKTGRTMLLEQAWMHDEARTVDWAVGAALLMRRAALEDIGGFDERFFMYVEDLEWCWRARQRGWTILFEPDAVVRHIGNVSGEQRYADRRMAAYVSNTYRFYRDEHGAAAASAFKWLNVLGAARNYVEARLSRDEKVARYWRLALPVYMGRRMVDDRGDD